MTIRPKAIWRFGLPAILVAGVVSAGAQGQWSSIPWAVVFWGGFGAMAWRWRLEVDDRHLRVTRLRTVELELDHVRSRIDFVVSGPLWRHLEIRDATQPSRGVNLLLSWWGGWRELAVTLGTERDD